MRILTVIGLCDETGYQTYAANARTHFKIQQGSIGAEKHQYDNRCVYFVLKEAASPPTQSTDYFAVSISILAWYLVLQELSLGAEKFILSCR